MTTPRTDTTLAGQLQGIIDDCTAAHEEFERRAEQRRDSERGGRRSSDRMQATPEELDRAVRLGPSFGRSL